MTLKEFGENINKTLSAANADFLINYITFDGIIIKGWVLEPHWCHAFNPHTGRHDDPSYTWLNLDPAPDYICEFCFDYCSKWLDLSEYGMYNISDIENTEDFSMCKVKL